MEAVIAARTNGDIDFLAFNLVDRLRPSHCGSRCTYQSQAWQRDTCVARACQAATHWAVDDLLARVRCIYL